MHRFIPFLAVLLLSACNPAADSSRDSASARNPKSYPILPDADASSPVKIASIEALCRKVDSGHALLATAMAFKGQRLRWSATVESVQGQRIVAGAGTVRVALIAEDADEYAADDEVEIEGIISSLDPKLRLITLGAEASVSPADG